MSGFWSIIGLMPGKGPPVALEDVVAAWELEYWQEPPVASIVELYPKELQAVIDSKIMDIFGEHVLVGSFEPADFFLPGYEGTNRAQIMADVFNENIEIIEYLLDDYNDLFGEFEF